MEETIITPTQTQLKSILESLLFVARKPLSAKDLEQSLQTTKELIEANLEELISEYSLKGINIFKVAGGYLMGTNPDNVKHIHALLHEKVQTSLSPQALETLAIIAYKQPVTRAEIERVRGVNSDGPIDTLLEKKLIDDQGRSDAVGRPFLFATTTEFLRHFGLKEVKDLPVLPTQESAQEEIFKTALQE